MVWLNSGILLHSLSQKRKKEKAKEKGLPTLLKRVNVNYKIEVVYNFLIRGNSHFIDRFGSKG